MNDAAEVWTADTIDRQRWRPVVEPILERLVGALKRDRFPHALMLSGPAGLGRELAALETAALLTCHNKMQLFCECPSCQRVRAGNHPDVTVIQAVGAAERITIDQIRGVVETAPGRPYEASARVWILDGVEVGRFGAEAANAFLKTLEEPPEHVRFVLLAANPEAVLPTIRSRCQRVTLPGSVRVARLLGLHDGPPEMLASALRGDDLETVTASIREALDGCLEGEPAPALRLAQALSDEPAAFELLAAVALTMATEGDAAERAESLVRLAAESLARDRRTRALNLNRGRQLTSLLMGLCRDEADLSSARSATP